MTFCLFHIYVKGRCTRSGLYTRPLYTQDPETQQSAKHLLFKYFTAVLESVERNWPQPEHHQQIEYSIHYCCVDLYDRSGNEVWSCGSQPFLACDPSLTSHISASFSDYFLNLIFVYVAFYFILLLIILGDTCGHNPNVEDSIYNITLLWCSRPFKWNLPIK